MYLSRNAEFGITKIKFADLKPEVKIKYLLISRVVVHESNILMRELFQKYNLRWLFALNKYSSYKRFARNELFKACEELTSIELSFEWFKLFPELSKITRMNGKSSTAESMDNLLWEIISSSGLAEEYLELNTDLQYSNVQFNYHEIVNMTSLKEIIEIIGRLRYLEFLTDVVNSGDYNTMVEVKNELPTLPNIFKNVKDFVFYLDFPQVKDLYDIRNGETYHLKPGKKGYLAGFAHKLLNTGKLIDDIRTSQDLAKVFCPFFHVPYNNKEDKQFQPDRAKTDEFSFIV